MTGNTWSERPSGRRGKDEIVVGVTELCVYRCIYTHVSMSRLWNSESRIGRGGGLLKERWRFVGWRLWRGSQWGPRTLVKGGFGAESETEGPVVGAAKSFT